MSEPNGCPTPGACSAAAQIAELTKEWDAARDHASRLGDQIGEEARISDDYIAALMKDRDHWCEAYFKTMSAADSVIEIERQRVRDALKNSARLIEERNECRSIATDNLSALQTATARIATAQAQIARLRDALEYVAPMYNDVAIVQEALSLTTDTSALDAWLAQERERCAKELEGLDHMNFHRAAYYIREMK